MGFKTEIRDGRLHISGYVNAVERDSLPIMTARGKCVEQIRAGAFAQSMADGHEIRLRYNHKRDIGSTSDGALTLREDSIGLYAEAVTSDEEVITLAGKGELRGWSFGFVAKDDDVEERQNNIPRRHINALDLREVSILSVQPAYTGTSLEYRDADGVELRAYDVYEDESAQVEVHRVNGEIKAIVETEREHSEQPSDDGNTMTDTTKRTEVSENGIHTDTVTEEHTWQRDNAALNARIERMKMQGILMKLQAERKEIEDRAFRSELALKKAKMDESRAELEERYNHYHDPRTGQFASGKGGGAGLYYSMGKGRGEVVGASSSLVPTQEAVATALRDAVAQNPNGNLEVTIGTSVYSKRGKNSRFKQGGFREHAEREVYESIQSHTRIADLLYGIHGTPTGLASTTRNKSYDMLSASEKKDFAYAHAREIEKKMPKNILRETYGLDGKKAAKKYGQLSFF